MFIWEIVFVNNVRGKLTHDITMTAMPGKEIRNVLQVLIQSRTWKSAKIEVIQNNS